MRMSYMGTKRRLAPHVASIAHRGNDGPFLDLFSGLCTVAAQIGTSRALWSNDAQLFAANVGAALLTSQTLPLSAHRTAPKAYSSYKQNLDVLYSRWAVTLSTEKKLIERKDWVRLGPFYNELSTVQTDLKTEHERQSLSTAPATFPFRLASITFAGGYFGLKQSTQLDSIRFAIEKLYQDSEINLDQRRWLCLALCVSAHRIATTTGHFAQYLKITKANSQKYLSQRSRSAWKEWLTAVDELTPIGSTGSRKSNCAFHGDAIDLLQSLKNAKRKPAIVYADPPYTKDQYSRYYHVLDTLLSYSYPDAHGQGRYPANRFTSTFSLASSVRRSIEKLAENVAALDSQLILSYPTNGLLKNSQEEVHRILRQSFRKTHVRHPLPHQHSTFGASTGEAKKAANELLFVASQS